MFINTKEEIEISNLINELKSDDKNIDRLISIRNKISELVKNKKFNMVDLIFDYLESDTDTMPNSLFEGFLEEAIQTYDEDNKKFLLLGIPVILLEAKYKNNFVYEEKTKKIDDELGYLKDIIEERLNSVFSDNVSIKVHNKMVDYANFDDRYENIIKLFSNISKNNLNDNPILQGENDILASKNSSFDCLKFILCVAEIDTEQKNKNDTSLNNFLEIINQVSFTDDDLVDKFKISFLQKKFFVKKVMIGKTGLLLHSIKESIRMFYYFSDFNAMSAVFYIESDPSKLYCNVSLVGSEGFIVAEFYHVDDDEQYIYQLYFDQIIDGYEAELKKILAILVKLEIKYELFNH